MQAISIGSAGALTLTIVASAAGAGFAIGRRVRSKKGEADPPVGSMVGATLGLLAFVLAFTFGMAAQKHDARRRLVLDEANAIATAALRAELLSEDDQRAARERILEYVDLRLRAARREVDLGAAMARSEELQTELWAVGKRALRDPEFAAGARLFLTSTNEVIDLHTERVAIGVRDRLPGALWAGLYLLTTLGMLGVGYHAGMAGSARIVPVSMLVLAFSTVVLLIADLDHPASGFLRVSQLPLEDLLLQLRRG